MIPAPLPPNEEQRLAALEGYEILDTLPESQLDDITKLAATICGVPIALVSLIDRDRQWFKSRQGLAAPETPRDVAFCAHAILGESTMIVEDSLLDVRFHDNPLVTGEPVVRFYAGAPLVVATGECIGTLCVIDHEPRTLSAQQVDALRTLARHVVTYLELRKKSLELARAENRFRLLSDAAPVGIYLADRQARRIYTNPAWQQISGLTLEESLGHGWLQAVHPDDRERVLAEWQQAVAEGRDIAADFRFRTRDGTERYVVSRARRVEEMQDGEEQWVGSIIDITLRRKAELMLDRFFHLSLDLLCVAGTDGYFKRLNPAFTEVLGYSEEEMLARPFIDFVYPDDRESTLAELAKLADGRPTLRFENRYLHRDGGVRWIAWTASPVAETGMIYAAARDVTDAKLAAQALHASESAMRSIIGSSLSGIVTFSREGRIASVNPAAEKILGYSEAELVGRDISRLLPEPPADLQSYLRTSVDYALGRITEWNLRRGDGRIIPVEMALFEFETAEGKQLACNLHDVSERREVETMKREFVATVSHELRTPLTSIRGSLDLLKGEVLGPLTPQAAEVTSIAHRNTTRLIKLINDILDLDRLDSGKMEMNAADTDAATIVHTAAESVRSFAAQSAVEIIATAPDDALHADADRIVQVLVNLLSNAIKFSPRDSSVRLTGRREHGEFVFEVEDHGRGIPREYLDRIFDRFQQVESSDSRTKGGSGLGLAICKAIVEQHEGTIGVVSEEGSGSTFTVRLPLPRPAGSSIARASAQSAILIVEDDAELLAVLRRQLERDGLDVHAVAGGRAALAMIRAARPQLIVLDVGLPDIDGFDLVAILRGDETLCALPLLVYTGRDLDAAERARLTLGPTRFLTKSTADDREFRRLVAELIHPVQRELPS